VVEPKSGKNIHSHLRCDHKELAMMSFKRHCIVRGEGCEAVYERVAEFIRNLGHDTSRHRLPTI
jgi:esterase/lipase